MTEVKAIETIYRGHRFRSRLEARWAVFFDALGVEWQYEPQGFEKGGDRYLPDFRLSIRGKAVWAEVKGDPAWLQINKERVVGWFTGCQMLPGSGLLLLGEIPKQSNGALLFKAAWQGDDRYGRLGWQNLAAEGEWQALTEWPKSVLMFFAKEDVLSGFQPMVVPSAYGYGAVSRALDAARMARFEHGESGAR